MSLRTIIFAFLDYIRVFRPPLHLDLIIDFSHRSVFHFPILYGLPTPQTIPASVFRYPIPFALQFSFARDKSDTSYAQETSPRPSTTFLGTATLSAPIPFQSPILSAHHPLNPLDFRTSQIPPAPDSPYIPLRQMRTGRLTGDS